MLKVQDHKKHKTIKVKDLIYTLKQTDDILHTRIAPIYKKMLDKLQDETARRIPGTFYNINLYREEFLKNSNKKALYYLTKYLILSAFVLKEMSGKILNSNSIVSFVDKEHFEEWIRNNPIISSGCETYHECKNRQSDAVLSFEYGLFKYISSSLQELKNIKFDDISLKKSSEILNNLYNNIDIFFNKFKENPKLFIDIYTQDCHVLQNYFDYIRTKAKELNIYLPYAVLATSAWFNKSFRISYEAVNKINTFKNIIESNADQNIRKIALIAYAITVAESEEKIYINVNHGKIQARIAYEAIHSVYNTLYANDEAALNLIKSNDKVYLIALAYNFLKRTIDNFYNTIASDADNNKIKDIANDDNIQRILPAYIFWMDQRLKYMTGREAKMSNKRMIKVENTIKQFLMGNKYYNQNDRFRTINIL